MAAVAEGPETVFRVLLRMELNPGAGPDFERTWLEIGDAITDHPANRGQQLLRDTDDEDVYYIISDWIDEPGFRAFETSDAHLGHRTRLHPYRRGGSMSTMISRVWLPARARAAR
jgi:heme-degrading monooxygenase HmoA